MKKLLVVFLLITSPLAAKSYLSEYRGHGKVIIFHGDIKDDQEDEARSLQTRYLESLGDPLHPNRAHNFQVELSRLGVKISIIEDNPYIQSEDATPYFTPGPH